MSIRIPTWRLALTGGAIVVLGAVGIGLVAASPNRATGPVPPAAIAPSPTPSAASGAPAVRDRIHAGFGRPWVKPIARHLVHAAITVTDKDGHLMTIQLDHGTIASVGSGSLTISEAGGSSVTVSTDDATVVFLGRWVGKGTLADLAAGAEVFVQSRVDDGTTLAKHVLVVPGAAED